MTKKAIQDYYEDSLSHCYGCGTNNPYGHQIKSYLEGAETIARYTPDKKYSAGTPDHVYGGMVASLLDCHGTASAAAFACQAENTTMEETLKPVRFVTASLKVDFKNPTPMGVELEMKGQLRSISGRKVWVDLTLTANGVLCATGEILAIRMKE